MGKFKVFIFFISILSLLTSCSSTETVSSKEADKLVISDYFPQVGLERSYIQYGTTGENTTVNDIVVSETDASGKEMIYIKEAGSLAGEKITQYEVNNDSIRVVYLMNALKNEEADVIELTAQPEWKTGDGDDSVSYLTETGLDIEVPAGMFNHCIEVTNIAKSKSGEHKVVKYYAPKAGLIKTVFYLEDEGEFVFSELQTSNLDRINAEEKQLDENSDSPSSEQTLTNGSTYRNNEYGFVFTYPSEWDQYIKISEGSWAGDAEATIDINYIEDKIDQNVFSIVVFDYVAEEEQWDHPMMRYLAANNGKTFAISVAVEPSEELLKPENEKKLKYIQEMIANLEIVEDSFRFE
ncbi:hypothetical protein [Cytobacillus massiliigabonensis]|uniref:hypothetical protein n=1 Tax=Cytobacillus massiliigabonensis TaxID=1871011 RepID=UPI000C829BB8|nr:hypothetical protein [Cytobacillus massiliigabonensis]